MRLDKYLKVSRLIKRRTVAAGACGGGRVQVNGKDAKPGYRVRVKELRETVGKNEADSLYEVIDEP